MLARSEDSLAFVIASAFLRTAMAGWGAIGAVVRVCGKGRVRGCRPLQRTELRGAPKRRFQLRVPEILRAEPHDTAGRSKADRPFRVAG
jgi:hypothetical protein